MPKPLPRNKTERRALQDYNAERQRACRQKKKDAAAEQAAREKRFLELVELSAQEQVKALRPGEATLPLLVIKDGEAGRVAVEGTPLVVACHNAHGLATVTIERRAE